MRKSDRGAAIPIAALLVFLLTAWLGVAGPIVSDVQGKGAYEFLKDWQTLIAALIALAAAALVARPFRRQLSELQRQADQRSYETLRLRSVQLSDERALLKEIGKHMALAEQAVSAIGKFQIVIGIQPSDLDRPRRSSRSACDHCRRRSAACGATPRRKRRDRRSSIACNAWPRRSATSIARRLSNGASRRAKSPTCCKRFPSCASKPASKHKGCSRPSISKRREPAA